MSDLLDQFLHIATTQLVNCTSAIDSESERFPGPACEFEAADSKAQFSGTIDVLDIRKLFKRNDPFGDRDGRAPVWERRFDVFDIRNVDSLFPTVCVNEDSVRSHLRIQ